MTETLGFVTGALAVWLLVRESIWNWPAGIANGVFYLVLFAQARFFADSALQIVYIVLGACGWWYWLRGRQRPGGAADRARSAPARPRCSPCSPPPRATACSSTCARSATPPRSPTR